MNTQGLTKLPWASMWLCMALIGIIPGSQGAIVLNFDEFSPGANSINISNGYGGLQWDNFQVQDGTLQPVGSGKRNGMVSTNNIAVGSLSSVSRADLFDLNSGYL